FDLARALGLGRLDQDCALEQLAHAGPLQVGQHLAGAGLAALPLHPRGQQRGRLGERCLHRSEPTRANGRARTGPAARASDCGCYIIPPMPPMPPIAAAAAAALCFSGLSATTDSVVRSSAAIDAAFCSAERVTLAGSMTPALNRSSYCPVTALSPTLPVSRSTCWTCTAPSSPALRAIHLSGSSSALRTIIAPVASSPVSLGSSSSMAERLRTRATPPPATMPSSMAALVADTASSMRCFFSLSSTSVAALSRTTATP